MTREVDQSSQGEHAYLHGVVHGWVDTVDDANVDPPDVPDAELSDPAVEDAACGDGLAACEGECVDTMVDMGNCGGCGIRCEAGHTTEVCTAGACEIVGCEEGWHDRNGDPYDGC